jgi:acyl phosphate:glycerol-3-phosphate acyltransferase
VPEQIIPILFALLIGYALGAIPFGLILTRVSGGGDIRNIGSGNIGATNVLRTGNKGLAAATLLLDILKGYVAVRLASYFLPGTASVAAAGSMAARAWQPMPELCSACFGRAA